MNLTTNYTFSESKWGLASSNLLYTVCTVPQSIYSLLCEITNVPTQSCTVHILVIQEQTFTRNIL